MRVLIDPGGLQPGRLVPPPSKSDAQRALVLAHLLGAAPLWEAAAPPGVPLPDDVRVVERGLLAIARSAASGEMEEVDCGDGGAPFRLLLTQAATTPGAAIRFKGSRRLAERPHRPLLAALEEALGPIGLRLHAKAPWPLEVLAPRETGAARPMLRVDSTASSQFASSLLLGACGLFLRERRPWTVVPLGLGGSEGYLEMSVRWAERCGFAIERQGGALQVVGHAPPPSWPQVPGDWSSLGYLLLLAWASGGEVAGVDPRAEHPDRAVLRILEEAGLRVTVSPSGTARVEGTPLRGLRGSGAECPDLLPTLAALACVCPAPSVLEEVHTLRAKESDRLAGICDLVEAAGGQARLEGSRLTLHPPERPAPFAFSSRGDHRMAMSASTLAVLGRVPLELEDPDCVSKSFPGFFGALEAVGVGVRRV